MREEASDPHYTSIILASCVHLAFGELDEHTRSGWQPKIRMSLETRLFLIIDLDLLGQLARRQYSDCCNVL